MGFHGKHNDSCLCTTFQQSGCLSCPRGGGLAHSNQSPQIHPCHMGAVIPQLGVTSSAAATMAVARDGTGQKFSQRKAPSSLLP